MWTYISTASSGPPRTFPRRLRGPPRTRKRIVLFEGSSLHLVTLLIRMMMKMSRGHLWRNTGRAEPACSKENLIHRHVANGNNVQKLIASTHGQCVPPIRNVGETLTQQDSDTSAVYGINRTLGESRTKYKYTVIRNDCQGFDNLSYTIHLR